MAQTQFGVVEKKDELKFGVIVRGLDFTVEIAKAGSKLIKQRKNMQGYAVKCSYNQTENVMEYKIKIMARYKPKFLSKLGISKPGNKRNHSIITKSKIQRRCIIDIQMVNAYINVMEEQILKDIAESLKSGKLIKRSSKEIKQLKEERYGQRDRIKRPRSIAINKSFELQRLSQKNQQ